MVATGAAQEGNHCAEKELYDTPSSVELMLKLECDNNKGFVGLFWLCLVWFGIVRIVFMVDCVTSVKTPTELQLWV